jgi:hypothetical protein
MSENIRLNRVVFNKTDFTNTVNTAFTQLVAPPVPTGSAFTVEDFFVEYENLFFQIPKQGETNSHEYLVTKSGEYINFEQTNAEIQALLDEIAQLRQELLDASQSNFELEVELNTLKQSSALNQNQSPSRANSRTAPELQRLNNVIPRT